MVTNQLSGLTNSTSAGRVVARSELVAMWRSNQQVQAAARAVRPFVDLVVERDDRVWRFWALAPVKVAGADAVWVSDGVEFRIALVDRYTGAVWWSKEGPRSVDHLAAARAVCRGSVRMADDVVTDTALFGSAKSPGCPCSGCAPVAVRKAALVRHATAAAAA